MTHDEAHQELELPSGMTEADWQPYRDRIAATEAALAAAEAARSATDEAAERAALAAADAAFDAKFDALDAALDARKAARLARERQEAEARHGDDGQPTGEA